MLRVILVLAALITAASGHVSLGAQAAAPALKITSPLGRTGLPGTIRIVARLEGEQPDEPPHVSFYIDKLHLADDSDGPPYEALWSDDNPFEPREISVRAEFASGAVLTDALALNALVVTEAVEVTSIAIEASVVDPKGRFVRDLTESDFTLLENAEEQEIDLVSQRRQPALFALLVDSSQSMALRYSAVRAAASQLLEPLHPDDAVIVAPFAREITTVTGPTSDHATVLEAISAIQPTGGTAILDAIQQMVEGLPSEGYERRAVILITDGYDEHSTAQFDATIAALRASDVTMYVIGVGGVAGISLKGEKLLSQLAEQTGGRAWFPRDRRRLVEAYATTAEDVQQRYLLTYTPTNQRRDGTLRRITVKTRTPDFVVRARESYTAPMAPPIRASLEFTAIGEGQRVGSLDAGRPRRPGGRRPAEGGRVPGGRAARDVHACPRLERQHDQKRREGAGGRAWVRGCASSRGPAGHDSLCQSRRVHPFTDGAAGGFTQGDRRVQGSGRDGFVRCRL